MTFQILPAEWGVPASGELKVWVHSRTVLNGGVAGITAAGQKHVHDLGLAGGVIVRPLGTAALEVHIDLGSTSRRQADEAP